MTGSSRVQGTTLDWSSIQKIAPELRTRAVQQILGLWGKHKDRQWDPFLWGDETEGNLVTFDDEQKVVEPLSTASSIIERCMSERHESSEHDAEVGAKPIFVPECASFNIESMPGLPWGLSSVDLLQVESNMMWRRAVLSEHLNSKQSFLTTTNFPMLGASKPCGFLDDESKTKVQRSQFLRDDILAPFPRPYSAAANVRLRRRRKPAINIPVYRDQKTPWPFRDPTVDYDLHIWPEDDDVRNGAVEENCVYLDTVISGSCCCALQVTMQASNMDQARWLYDQLIPLGPVMLALTAATPIFKGYLTDLDVRWSQFAMGSDDRTTEELSQSSKCRVSKVRASSNSVYISQDARLGSDQQDPNLDIDIHTKRQLEAGGMDDKLATHFAYLFIRDPLTVYEDQVDAKDKDDTGIFDAIQSSNWQTVRFKPPPSVAEEDIGWRVEFRSMEVQLTDFENAAFAVFIVLLSQALLYFDVSLYTPIPKVDRNLDQACARDAVISGRFWFVKALKSHGKPSATATHSWTMERSQDNRESSNISSQNGNSTREEDRCTNSNNKVSDHSETVSYGQDPMESSGPLLMTIDEIMNGQEGETGHGLGLVPLIKDYIRDTNAFNPGCIAKIEAYLALVSSRARGSTLTSARWQRNFVRSHPQYREDSLVGQAIAYDLLRAQTEISRANGKVAAVGKDMFVEKQTL